MTGAWTDSRIEKEIEAETAIIENIIKELSCSDLKRSERILTYCVHYLRDKESTPELADSFKEEILKKMGITKDTPTG